MSRSGVRRCKTHGERLREKWAAEKQRKAKRLNAGEVIAHLGDHMARREEAGHYKQAELGRGAQLNNMAPPKYTPQKVVPSVSPVHILQQGIDSIWLNIYGEIKPEVIEALEAGKAAAVVAEGDWALSPLPPFDGTDLRIHASGVKYYQYLCGSDDISVTIRKPSRSPRPMAVVRVSAMALWRMGGGGREALRLAGRWLLPIFDDGYRVVVKRVDLATDFQGWRPGSADLENVVGRAGHQEDWDGVGSRKGDGALRSAGDWDDGGQGEGEAHLRAHYSRARRLTGISAGRSNVLRLNMYDKGHQARQEQKDWVFALWGRCEGYDRSVAVWRAEYQFGRTFLREHGIESVGDMLTALAGIWAEGMAWYSFRVPSVSDTNRSRWAVAPAWEALSRWGGLRGAPLPKREIVRPKYRRLCQAAFGYAVSIAAITGENDQFGNYVAPNIEDLAAIIVSTVADMAQEAGPVGQTRLDKRIAERRLRYAGFTLGA
jgi:hypothetical protein